MVGPFPYEAVTGRISLAQRASEIYGHYTWLARWSDEIGKDPDVDLKKAAQLAFIHCRLFVELVDAWGTKAAVSIMERFAASGIVWATEAAMSADLTPIRNEALSLHNFAIANKATMQEASKIIYSEKDSSGIEQVNKLAKPSIVADEVAKLRALFDVVPT